MCASVCPSGALYFGTREEMARMRPASKPVNTFQFGMQTIHTKVSMMVPEDVDLVDVVSSMHEPVVSHDVTDDVFMENMHEETDQD